MEMRVVQLEVPEFNKRSSIRDFLDDVFCDDLARGGGSTTI